MSNEPIGINKCIKLTEDEYVNRPIPYFGFGPLSVESLDETIRKIVDKRHDFNINNANCGNFYK
jgi:hypothetical protein